MKNNKELLLAQLTDLHTTMLGVNERGQELGMRSWIKLSSTIGGHFCDTVACVCGWQSLGNLDNFPLARAWANNWRAVTNDTPEGVATRLSDDLGDAVANVFGDSAMAKSIYDGDTECRRFNAKDSGLFSKEELNHPHLNKEPTALEAASYIALCSDKVKGG